MLYGTLAIVGSPNVGKSTIFNRIVGKRTSIIDDEPGITRDRIYAKAEWLTHEFSIVDTGGIELANRPFQEQIRMQAEIAIKEADVILFIVDGKIGVTKDDRLVAKILYKAQKPAILAVNKIDNTNDLSNINDFFSLGLGEPIPVSGAHGIGIGDILDKIIKLLPQKSEVVYENSICFAVIGRPNVGKSSLVNAMLNDERVIVSEMEGTTRDAIDTQFVKDSISYVAIDTAGLKKRGQIFESIDKYSALRALSAIDRAKICLLVIDATKGMTEQDKHVVGYAVDLKKAIIVVVNKWDLVKKDEKAMSDFTKNIRDNVKFLEYAPVIYISAKNKSRIKTVFDAINHVSAAYQTRVLTSVLNEIIQDAQVINPTPDFNGGRLKIYFANQVSIEPPTIVLFVNKPKFAHFSYLRYIENRLRDTFDFDGTPIDLVLRERV
ncbi:MAG: ribosome biogenesis GTPase Der [Bacilli bacterium]|jgi:GTP-binding protein